MADCHNCGQPAQHEAESVGSFRRWLPYCCACFNHDWPEQRLIDGQQCGKVLVIRQGLLTREWQWRKEEHDG